MDQSINETARLLQSDPVFAKRFDVIRLLGGGAAGLVFLVVDHQRKDEKVAFKFLAKDSAFDDRTLDRFLAELAVCQKIIHPNVVRAYDLIHVGGSVGYTMEFIDGEDLMQRMTRLSPTESEVVAWFDQILKGVSALHAQGIVHRDLKLENVLLSNSGAVKISDLGLLKRMDLKKGLTRTGILLGTAQYMPPEYIKWSDYDQRGDLYAVGMMLWEVLGGARRLADLNGMQAIEHLIQTRFATPLEPIGHCNQSLRFIVSKALEIQPKRRWQTAAEMRAALITGAIQPPHGHQQPKIGIVAQVRRWVSRWQALAARGLAAIGVAGLLAVVGLYWRGNQVVPVGPDPGAYVGKIHLFKSTGFFKPVKATVDVRGVVFQSEFGGCETASIALGSLSGSCAGGEFEIEITDTSKENFSGELRHTKKNEAHSFSLAKIPPVKLF